MLVKNHMTNEIVARWIRLPQSLQRLTQGLVTTAMLALLTYCGFYLQINLLTISFLYLLMVVAVAARYGFWLASFTSVLAVLLLDFFFEPPLFSFEVENVGILVALVTFELTALTISRLHGRETRGLHEAALNRAEMEQLYELSRSSLLLDLRQPPGTQLAVLIDRIFEVSAVAMFDANLGRQDRLGDWTDDEENLAKDCFLRNNSYDDASTSTWQRVLRAGTVPVGALVVRGNLSPLVLDALGALAAIAMDRHRWVEKEERAENAKKDEQLRATVMDALAHELKTPLTAVQTASSGLLELGNLTDSQIDLVSLINREAVRLNELCTRLLKAARLDATKMGLETTEVNVLNVVSEALFANTDEPERNVMKVSVEDPALNVHADRGLFTMILSQFIDNAQKYSPAGTPITISARGSKSDVLVSVHNLGSTIRIEDRERIFERFYRSPEMKDSVPGTGIGLSVVKKAAEALHGHVWVISDEMEGTTFFFSLPTEARRPI
jgi:two-component system sensor histidine kinase KdpD